MESNESPQISSATNFESQTSLAHGFSTREMKLRNGDIVVNAGAPLMGLITVQTGRLKRYRLHQSQPFLAGIVATGETVGLGEWLEFSTVHCETLEAVGETTILIHSAKDVAAWVRSAPPSLLEALRVGAPKHPDRQIRRPLELLPVRARVAATIWSLAERHGRHEHRETSVRVIDLDLTREEIAHLAGTVYESVIRTLTALKKEGVIDLQGRVIRILNESQLARIGQIAVALTEAKTEAKGELHDQNTVSENRRSSNNSRPQEAS